MKRVIILGAGASKGTLGEQAPVSADFGKYLHCKETDWVKDYPYLAAAVKFLEPRFSNTRVESWALDKVWSAVDTKAKLRHILGDDLPGAPFPTLSKKNIYKTNQLPWIFVGFELKCALARVYGTALEPQMQEVLYNNGTAKKEFDDLHSGDYVISFNYDLLAERILTKLRGPNKIWTRVNPFFDTTVPRDNILLCKPHGSLDWEQRFPERGRTIQIINEAMKEEKIDHVLERNVTIQPGVVGPVPFKDELIFPGSQLMENPSFFHLLVAQWKCAIQGVSEADKLVVLGYGFPSEDLHARHMFADAAAKRERNKKLEIEIYEKDFKSFKRVKKGIDELFIPASRKYSCKYKGKIKP